MLEIFSGLDLNKVEERKKKKLDCVRTRVDFISQKGKIDKDPEIDSISKR